jgi:hypothetical protein
MTFLKRLAVIVNFWFGRADTPHASRYGQHPPRYRTLVLLAKRCPLVDFSRFNLWFP